MGHLCGAAVVRLWSAAPHKEGTEHFSWFLRWKKKKKKKSPRLVSGLVKEDVARLGVLGDFRREAVEFFYSLCINFLKDEAVDSRVRKQNTLNVTINAELKCIYA